MDYTYLGYMQYFVVSAVVIVSYCIRQWLNGGKCHSKARLDGKTVLITGANSGIGKETAVDLAKRGATIVMACRDINRSKAALKEVKERSGNSNVFLKALDLSSLASVREFAMSYLAEYEKLHILINNAGVMMNGYTKTSDDFEMHMGVNHFGHFALTNLLLERIIESAPGRIVNVSSLAHERCGPMKFDEINSENNYKNFDAYGRSKFANVLFTKELNRKLVGTGVTTYSLHPGVILTNISRHFVSRFHPVIFSILSPIFRTFVGKSVEQGAQTSIYCAVEEHIEEYSGLYFSDCALKASNKYTYDEGMAKKLWEISEEMTNVKFPL